jgi:hypothetical protein
MVLEPLPPPPQYRNTPRQGDPKRPSQIKYAVLQCAHSWSADSSMGIPLQPDHTVPYPDNLEPEEASTLRENMQIAANTYTVTRPQTRSSRLSTIGPSNSTRLHSTLLSQTKRTRAADRGSSTSIRPSYIKGRLQSACAPCSTSTTVSWLQTPQNLG